MFEKILNWKLLEGSHVFPGPDGGTCTNEAAIVAAGFRYSQVITCWDCPPCFSRPIAAYAIALNDRMPDDLRQELLLPFVTRLAGTADSSDIEIARMRLIALRIIRDLLPVRLRWSGLIDHARRCEQVADLDTAVRHVAFDHGDPSTDERTAAATAIGCVEIAGRFAADIAADAAFDVPAPTAAMAVAVVIDDLRAAAPYISDRQIFTIAASILDEAIRLGKQAEPIETALVIRRMEKMKQRALERV